jgi:hypothetical protein
VNRSERIGSVARVLTAQPSPVHIGLGLGRNPIHNRRRAALLPESAYDFLDNHDVTLALFRLQITR